MISAASEELHKLGFIVRPFDQWIC
jgi:hypothetical protein